MTDTAVDEDPPLSLYAIARRKLYRDKLAMGCFFVIVLFGVTALLTAFHIVPGFDDASVGDTYLPPGEKFFFGSDVFGRSVFWKAVHGTLVAMTIGLIVTAIAIPIGVFLGAIAGYFGGKVDEAVVWLYTTFSSIPEILLLLAISYVLGKGLIPMCVALGTVTWVATARLVRSEYLKHRELDYVEAAKSIGVGRMAILFRHILPNVMHIIIIQGSLRFVYAIKSEVILTYIGVGIQNKVSWGSMIADSIGELANGIWWQFLAATIAIFVVVFAFNYFNDAIRDALDPKLRHL